MKQHHELLRPAVDRSMAIFEKAVEAREKEWDARLNNRGARDVSAEENKETEREKDPSRILKSDFEYKNENNLARPESNPFLRRKRGRLRLSP